LSRKYQGRNCWYSKGILSHWVVAIATRSLGPIVHAVVFHSVDGSGEEAIDILLAIFHTGLSAETLASC
jgi:hypothetical protein